MSTLPLDDGVVLGWHRPSTARGAGFHVGGADEDRMPLQALRLPPETHAMVIGPTGCGKGRGSIIPALLDCAAPMIVIDPKGEAVAVTRRHREAMGHQVVVIDPMGVCGTDRRDALNPLDLLDPDSPGAVDDLGALAQALAGTQSAVGRDPFWVLRAMHLIVGTTLLVLENPSGEEPTLSVVRRLIDDAAANPKALSQRLGACEHPEARQVASLLAVAADVTVGGIVSVAQSMLDFLRGEQVAAAVSRTSFDLGAVTRGEPLTIYLVLPPHMLESHGRLLRLWLWALMTCIVRRRSRPRRSTLLLLDECAALGELPHLRQAITLLRGYGLRTISYWQDLSQLKHLYPTDWKSMLNNCKALQFFGAANMAAAEEIAQAIGWRDPQQLLGLDAGRVVLQLAGGEPVIARAPDYRCDAVYAGRFDENPYHVGGALEAVEVVPRRTARVRASRAQRMATPGAHASAGLIAEALRKTRERNPMTR